MSQSLLQVADLALAFGGLAALIDINLSLDRSECLAVIGPNGAGKTSLLNCLSGLSNPQRGSMVFEGHELMGASPTDIARLGVARTFQNLGLFANLDVVENLMLGRHRLMLTGFLAGAVWWGRARREERLHRRRCLELIELLDLGGCLDRPVGALPYGVQKRIELGRALAMEPRLLLLDEPAAGTSPEERQQVSSYLRSLQVERGLAIVLVDHDIGLVMQLADRVMVLDFGLVLATGAPHEVGQDPRVIAAYLGSAGANLSRRQG